MRYQICICSVYVSIVCSHMSKNESVFLVHIHVYDVAMYTIYTVGSAKLRFTAIFSVVSHYRMLK